MVAGDITVSSEREGFMDFSTPFMTIGLTILFKKPAGPEDHIFSFMSPLSSLTWCLILASYTVVSLLLYIVNWALEDPSPR